MKRKRLLPTKPSERTRWFLLSLDKLFAFEAFGVFYYLRHNHAVNEKWKRNENEIVK